MKQSIKLLDCTLRDGGLALEDAMKNNISDLTFSNEDVNQMLDVFPKTHIDIVEIGSIEISKNDKRHFCIHQNIESISKTIPENHINNQFYAALFRGPDTPIEDLPEWKPGLIKGIRVILRYSELKKSLDFCAALARKGYSVFVQPMLTMRYTENEIKMVIKAANDMHAYALYFVDSYGYMQDNDIINLYKKYDDSLDHTIRIGFHAHNNMNLAFSNALTFIQQYSGREIIVDSCALGMGQGAGNLQTEIISSHMNRVNGKEYNFSEILKICEIIEKYYGDNLWGYSVTRLLPAIHKAAYKYAVALRHTYKLSFVEINELLENMPEDLRQRYTPDNATKLLKLHGKL